jgi:hypothetical protein
MPTTRQTSDFRNGEQLKLLGMTPDARESEHRTCPEAFGC